MKIYDKNGEIRLDIQVEDSSYRYRTIMGDNSVTLYFSLDYHIEIPVGSYIDFQGERYTLWRPENFKKKGVRNFEYTILFGSNQEVLKKYKFKDLTEIPHRLKFSLTAKPDAFLRLLVKNLNNCDSGWKVGTCIDAAEKSLSFNHEYCYEVLGRLTNEFDTEWEIIGKTINLCKIEKFKDSPLPLSYGKGEGILPGTGRANQGDKSPVTVLYVQGGERNIDYSKYKSKSLLLPKSQELEYEGRHYRTDEYGMYITRSDIPLESISEDSLDCSETYPKRIGVISEVITVDKDKNFYDFIDSEIPDSLDYSQCRIAGEKATIIFQSGILAGKEFDIEQTDDSLTGYIHQERRFKLVPQEIDGVLMPNETFKPSKNDTYAVFNISLPDAYTCDNVSKTGASWDMFRDAVRYFYEHEESEFTFSGTLDGIWSKKRWLEIGGRILLGSYILFSDEQFQPDGIKIRITGIKDYINKPHSPEIELSNNVVAGTVSSDLGKVGADEVIIEGQYKNALKFTKRRFRDAMETMGMLEKAFLNFSNSIDPITVHTMQLLVGDESLQFRFVNSKTNPVAIVYNITYDSETKVLVAPSTILQHMTLGISSIASTHESKDYKFWNMASYYSPALGEPEKKYYLYARVSKTNSSGTFLLSETAIKMEGVNGYYHLLVGVLNSEYEGERSFVELYGFTEILPGRITTDLIVSSDGKTYFSLTRGEIGGNIKIKSGSSGLHNLEEWDELDSQISAVEKSAESANNAVVDLGDYVDGAFSDGIISEAEAKAIEKYINTVNSTKSAVEATYSKLYTNAYLKGTAKTNLLNAKINLIAAINDLITAINTAIADGKTTVTEKKNVDNKFSLFNSAYASFNTAVEAANKAIQDALKEFSDQNSAELKVLGDQISAEVTRLNDFEDGYEQFKSEIIQRADDITLAVYSGTGKMLYKDLEFKEGTNGTSVYSNSETKIGYERIAKSSDCPTGSDYMMRLTYTYGTEITPGLGGFYFGTQTRANAAFEAHILAKIPEGFTIEFATNAYGNNSYYKWLTSNEGTGKWQKYVCRVQCGSSGEFSTTNFFYLNGTVYQYQYSVDGSVWLNYYFSAAVWVRKRRTSLSIWSTPVRISDQPNYNKLIWYVGAATVYDLLVNEDLVSQINLSPEKIKIKSSKIELEGLTTINEKFKVLEDGSVEAVDGKFTGILNAGAGSKIGGMTLKETYTIGISAEFEQVPMDGLWYPTIILKNYKKYQIFGLRTDGVGSGIDLPNRSTVKNDFGSDDITFELTIIILSTTVSSSSFHIYPYGYVSYRDTYIRDSNGNVFNNVPANNAFDTGCIYMTRGNIVTIRYVMGDYYLVSKNF